MAGKQTRRVRQRAKAGRDANIAGQNQFIFNVGAARAGDLVVPGLLPRDLPYFTGRRRELEQLAGLAGGGAMVVTAIGGTAGVGKTALAVRAAHQLAAEFPDGNLYADLRGYTVGQAAVEPGEVLEVFLRRLGVRGEDIPAHMEERSGLMRQLLASRRVLMLLDNAATEAQVRPLLPGAGGSLVLVTSRSVLPGLEVDERISLDVLSEAEAAGLLAGLMGTERAAAEPQAVAEVTSFCGRLPLALRIAGQVLAAHPAWQVAKVAGILAAERDRLGQLTAGDLQVRAAFEVSYRLLTDADARLFRLLGLHPGPEFDVPSAAALAGIEAGTAGPVVNRLVEAYLVTEDGTGLFGMHDLLRLFAHTTCQHADDQADRNAAEARLVGLYTNRARRLNLCVDPNLRPAAVQAAVQAGGYFPSMRQALALFAAERPNLVAVLGLAAQRGWDEQVGQLAASMGSSLKLLRYLDDLLTVGQAALHAAGHTGNTSGEGRALTNIGDARRELRQFEDAVGCYQQSLALFRETGDRHGEGQTLINLGEANRQLGRFEEAIDYFQRSLALFRETGDRHDEGRTLNNLGITYQGLRQFGDAVGYFQQSLALFRETGDQRGEGLALNNLGISYRELCRFEDSVGYFQQSLALIRETGDRYSEGLALINLGMSYRKLCRFEDSVGCCQRSLALFRETGDRYSEGLALNNLGYTYEDLAWHGNAVGCYQQSLALFQETGDRHHEGLSLKNLGNAYQKLGQSDSAVTCWRDAASAMRDSGDNEQAARLERRVASVRSGRRRWRRNG